MIDTSQDVGDLAAALSKAQAEIKGAMKDSDNPFFKSKYADLASVWEACRTALTNHGIAVMQGPTVETNVLTVTTLMLHTSGQWARSALSTTLKDQSPQVVGSATTYLRRYGLAAMAGVAPADDDDGNAAQGNVGEGKKAFTRGGRGPEPTVKEQEATIANAPYGAREVAKAAAKLEPEEPWVPQSFKALMELRAALPAEVRDQIPMDESDHAIPDLDAEANRQHYTDGIKRMTTERKLNASELGDLKQQFFGARRTMFETQDGDGNKRPNPRLNIYFLRALYLHMEPGR